MTRKELNVVKDITQTIRKETDRLLRLVDWIKRITQELDGLPHDQSFQRSKIEELTIQKIDCENNINKLKAERAEQTAELVKRLDDAIEDNNQKVVLVERYGFGQCFKKIAEKLHMSENNVYYLHRKGLRILYG